MWHSPFKLYLYPDSPDIEIDTEQLEFLLNAQQLTGAEISNGRYATGEHFLSLLTFMGCSPDIEIEPQDDKPYCYIEIGSSETSHFISGKNFKAAPCPKCKSNIQNILNPADKLYQCPNCNASIETAKLNWRKSAFIAKAWISIGNIYELEAIPCDSLLAELEIETGVKWKAAYIREGSV